MDKCPVLLSTCFSFLAPLVLVLPAFQALTTSTVTPFLKQYLSGFANGNPCEFPMPYDFPRCRIYDQLLRRYNMCDPQSSTSMDVADVIAKKLDEVYLKKDDTCICNKADYHPGPCWYKIGFAFLKYLRVPSVSLPSRLGSQICTNDTVAKLTIAQNPTSLATEEEQAEQERKLAQDFGDDFVRIVRERWDMGGCGEDILFLVVQNRPAALSTKGRSPAPVIFVSWGDKVEDRTGQLLTRTKQSLRHIVTVMNGWLEQGYHLKAVYVELLKRFVDVLTMADRFNYMPRNKSHIPDWAMAAFGGCLLLLIIMAVGLCLIKKGVRRGPSHTKMGQDMNRGRWKAGFVGGAYGALGEAARRQTIATVEPFMNCPSRGPSVRGKFARQGTITSRGTLRR